MAYLALATSVFLFARFAQRMDAVRYHDLLWPPRWSQYRTARGDHHITTAGRLAASGHQQEALLVVRAGLALSPANCGGRLLLAELLTEAGQPERARDALLDGLEFHRRDPSYVARLCALLLRQQEDHRVIELADRQLAASTQPDESASVLALAAAAASYRRGDCDDADQFLHAAPGLCDSNHGRLLAAKIESDRGHGEVALLRLQQLVLDDPDDYDVHAEFVSQLKRCGRSDEARRVLLKFQIAHPNQTAPRLALLRAYRLSGDIARANYEAEAFVRDFASDAPALAALAEVGANTGDVALARRLSEHAAVRRFPGEVHAILVVEALLVARDFDGAVAAGEALLQEHRNTTAAFTSVVSSLLAIAHFGLHDEEAGRRLLALHLDQPHLRAENLIALAQRLVEVGAVDQARAALTRAISADPRSQTALTRLVELDLNYNLLDELPANLTRLLAMRRPSPDVLRVAQHKLGSDRFLFSPERPAVLQAVRRALEKSQATASRE